MAKEYLSASPPYVVVEKGDTLSEIAEKYGSYIAGTGIYGDGGKLETLMRINDIPNADKIVVGQKIKLSGPADSSGTNNSNKANIKLFGLQSNTDRTLYVSWEWDKSNTDHYLVRWKYATGDGISFQGSDDTVDAAFKNSTYNAPSNATKVSVTVKPISKTKTVNNKETNYWTAEWSTVQTYNFKDSPPGDVSAPSITLDKYKLTASLENLDINADKVHFQVVKNDTTVYKNGLGKITTGSVSYSCTLDADGEYKVRCRGVRSDPTKDIVGNWSEYSEKVRTVPAKSGGITVCKAQSKTSVYLEWSAVASAKSYDIEYTTERDKFDKTTDTDTVTGIELTYREITGLEQGYEYFFRVRAVNDSGASAWSDIKSAIVGTDPSAPTTWSSSTTVGAGDAVTLYWVHNSKDGSKEKKARVTLVVENSLTGVIIYAGTVEKASNNDEDEDEEITGAYTIDTTPYSEGTIIKWTVATMGVTEKYGEESAMRIIEVYANPTLEVDMIDVDENAIDILESLPFYVSILTGPATQVPIGYHLSIVSNDFYETTDNAGNVKYVNIGEEIYSRYHDVTPTLISGEYYQVIAEISAKDISLSNNVDYTLTCVVSFNSGMTVTESKSFSVSWSDTDYVPNAEMGYDSDNYMMWIRPYCEYADGTSVEGVLLSVYRKEFDGKFTELITDVENGGMTFITDPHPSLDYARYRIVAKSEITGQICYYDPPGYPINCKAIIIQWEEDWRAFDVDTENPSDPLSEPIWSGSMLKLPYNIDINDDYSPDVSFVEYIGREHPISYYGTQLGETSTWSTVIDKDDTETIYALRRLAKWPGNAYVREPSGSGYWANVKLSIGKKHLDRTIPISFSMTRVEGGV